MAQLAVKTRRLDMHLEQVQDFTPTPMTLATEIYYTGIHPYTGKEVFTAVTPAEKQAQRQYFFWYDRDNRRGIVDSLRRLGRQDLIAGLFPGGAGGYTPRREPLIADRRLPGGSGSRRSSGDRMHPSSVNQHKSQNKKRK